jgi:arabinan endo-1,5-alpha-L-arabinosidase
VLLLAIPSAPRANAVIRHDCPDPAVLRGDHDAYYLVCTGGTFPIRTSKDLVTWTETGSSILPSGKAPWAGDGDRNWAPEIHRLGDGYVAYFAASDASGRLCIGAAQAKEVLGPWKSQPSPLVSQSFGVIDAHFFADDDGTPYLYWKVDGNAVGQPTPIYAQRLAGDGLSFAAGSKATLVLTNDPSTWEGAVVEAPWVVHRGAYYYLFYSGNVYDERYRMGVGRADSPLGPFAKSAQPLLQDELGFVGPGHGSVVAGPAGDYLFHHAWTTNAKGERDAAAGRWVFFEPLVYVGGWPQIGPRTSRSKPLPSP